MRKFQCLLFVLKRSYICYYIICMTVPLRSEQRPCKSVKILTSEQIACAVILYFGQVFVFCRSVNKNVLEWFQLVISKIYALTRSTNLLSRNHSILCFFFSSRPFTNHRTADEEGGNFFSSSLRLQPLHRHLHISGTITAESSPLHIDSSRT